MSTSQSVVVGGAGLGSLRVTEDLRRLGHTGGITLLGGENEPPFDRPPLARRTTRLSPGPAAG